MTEAQTHRCPNCGGFLTFNPDDQKFHCPYCLSIFTETEINSFTKEKNETIQDEVIDTTKQVNLYQCSSCGAEIYTNATTAATFCYYCHNPVVLVDRLSGEFAPEKIIPFHVNNEKANQLFQDWLKHKKYIDKNFFTPEQIEKLTGVYFPFWYIKSTGIGDFNATGRRIRVWRAGDTEYTETKEYSVKREGVLTIFNLLKTGLNKNLSEKMFKNVEPFDFSELVDFKTPYLAGFQAEKRDIEFNTINQKVKTEIEEYGQKLFAQKANGPYDHLTNQQFQLNEKTTPRYLLLPIWVLTYHHNQKVYYFAINGQTGKISGVLPVNYQKLILHGLFIFLVVLILGLLAGYFI